LYEKVWHPKVHIRKKYLSRTLYIREKGSRLAPFAVHPEKSIYEIGIQHHPYEGQGSLKPHILMILIRCLHAAQAISEYTAATAAEETTAHPSSWAHSPLPPS
jgi:hypothetical protein